MIRLYNCRLFDGNKLYDSLMEVCIDTSFVKSVSKWEPGKNHKEYEQDIDCHGNLIMPGFQNAHAHGPMTFLRSMADDCPLDTWLKTQVFPAEALLTAEDIYHLQKLAILEYIANGITSSYEMYYHPESIAKASLEMGFDVVINGTILGTDTDAVKELEEQYDRFHEYNELVSYTLGFHAEYTTALPLLEKIADLANLKKAPVSMHIQETQKEVLDCISRYGCSPSVLFDKIGIWNYGGSGFHFVYNQQNDYDLLKKHHIIAVTNPGSNMKLASGIAPLRELMDNGIDVAIGTDGPASNNALSMLREMYLAAGLQKLKYEDACGIDAVSVLKMACVNGAKAMHQNRHAGIIEGEYANLILFDLHRPNMQPETNLLKNIVYSGSDANVLMTMIHGRILYDHGRFAQHIDVPQIYTIANQIRRRISSQL